MAPLVITRPPSGYCTCDGAATPVTVSPTLFHGEPCVAHTHWLSLCACPRRLHAHLTRNETPQRGLCVLRYGAKRISRSNLRQACPASVTKPSATSCKWWMGSCKR